MKAFDIIVKRRNATNTGYEEVLANVSPCGVLRFDQSSLPEVGSGLAGSAGAGAIATQNGALTAALLLNGIIVHTTTTGAGTDTLDTAANIIAALTTILGYAPPVGFEFETLVINAGNQTITFAVAAGITLLNVAQTLAANVACKLKFTVLSATLMSCSIG